MDREFIQIERSQGAWHLIFQKLHQIARANAGSQQIAKKPMNAIRNRYRDVLPIDETRVKLDDNDNDYINANFVTVEEVNRKYILSQGPLQHTCPHFWQMIWEQNSTAIVMLNKCIERGMNKCFPYWPLAEDPPLEAGKFHIENLGTEDESCFRLSHLKLINTETEESRVIQHYHYTQWPDFGVPQNPDVFLEFLYAVRSGGSLQPEVGPAVVHCSAGIGRSGTFCLVDVILAKLEQTHDLASVDLQQILLMMRRQRLGLIQTPDQLRFSYIAVLQGALQDLELEPSNYDDLSDSEEDVPEEESEEESDSDEEVSQENRYPNLTRQYGRSQTYDADDDVPPPLPPRPPDTLTYSPHDSEESDHEREGSSPPPSLPPSLPPSPPPPPITLPPGPPSTHSPNEEEVENSDLLPKKMRLEENHEGFEDLHNGEEYGFTLASHDDSEDSDEEQEHEHQHHHHHHRAGIEESGNYDTLEQLPPGQARNSYFGPETVCRYENNEDVCREEHPGKAVVETGIGFVSETPPPPPVPPRSHSLSPSENSNSLQDLMFGGSGGGNVGAGRVDIYGENVEWNSNGRPFLGQGRGGEEMSTSPPLPTNHLQARGTVVTTTTTMTGPNDDTPPPLPVKQARRRQVPPSSTSSSQSQHLKDIKEEEQALISILNELERSVSNRSVPSAAAAPVDKYKEAGPVINWRAEQVSGGVSGEKLSPAEARQREREERRARISSKVQTIKEHLKQADESTEEWSIPWLLVGFIVIFGYCAYYANYVMQQ